MAEAGFSLTELMIVVAIIGILASLAIPRFQMFQAKARQSEARSNLTHIYTLQISYQGDNDTFSNFEFLTHGRVSGYWWSESPTAYVWNGYNLCNKTNDIGFRITDCKKVRYLYRNIGTQSTFLVYAAELDKAENSPNPYTGRRVFVGCEVPFSTDIWTIDQDKALVNSNNAMNSCK